MDEPFFINKNPISHKKAAMPSRHAAFLIS